MIPPHIKAFFNKKKDIKESFNVITRAADRASLGFSLRIAAARLVVSRRFVLVSRFQLLAQHCKVGFETWHRLELE
jgi:hypothetical protein